MFFSKNKNDSIEFLSLEEYKTNIDELITSDRYISKKDYISFYDANKDIYDKLILMEKESVLATWCKNNKTDYNRLKELLNYYDSTEKNVDEHKI